MTADIIRLRSRSPRSRPSLRVPGGGGLLVRVLGLLAALDARHRLRAELAEMDERMLRDIGVTRGEVEAEMRRPISWRSLLPHG